MTTIKIDPVTRIEGHLKLEVELDSNSTVTEAKSSGNLFRGFEKILQNRDPRDAIHITQRICGLCPVSHSIAAVKAVEDAFGFTPSHDTALTRSLIQGGNYLSDHILHFYHLALLDYVQGPQMGPWTPDYGVDLRFNQTESEGFIANYVKALEIRRKGYEMTALLSGKIPHVMSIAPGGVTQALDSTRMTKFKTYLAEIKSFIDNFYIPDANLLANRYSDYYSVGTGQNLLSYGVFDLNSSGSKLFDGGVLENGILSTLNETEIREYTKYSRYTNSSTGKHPSSGSTDVEHDKTGAYSWLKSPRYNSTAFEVGPLARMKINQNYIGGISVMDRHMARAQETQLLANAMTTWADSVGVGPHYQQLNLPRNNRVGVGLTEAPRGALGHWFSMSSEKVDSYQIITPTCWNASPKDDMDQMGALEQALVGTTVADPDNPVELLRIVHSFDPCTGCSVHIVQPEKGIKKEFVISTPNPSGLPL